MNVYDKGLHFFGIIGNLEDSSAFAPRIVRYQGLSKCCLRKKKHSNHDNAKSAGPSPERFSSNILLHFLDFPLLLERDLSSCQYILPRVQGLPEGLTSSRIWSVPSSSFSGAWQWKPWGVPARHGTQWMVSWKIPIENG